MSRVANGRAHLSIGEVLSLLQEEFPDVTISKIRFLESQGLLDPERTPSGYRKFYDDDIERLRWILRLQKDHYLPLKVIKDRLDAGEHIPATTNGTGETNGTAPVATAAIAVSERAESRAVAAVPAPGPRRTAEPEKPAPQAGTPAANPRPTTPPTRQTSAPSSVSASPRPARAPQASPRKPAPQVARPEPVPVTGDAVSLDIDGLAEASGLSVRDVRDLERFGLIEARETGESTSYDGDALIVARTAAGFLQHGIEARHMRTYKVAIDREAGLFEQIVSPVLKQRNPEARTRASRTVAELIRLGEVMRGVLLRRELRDLLDGP